MIDYNALASSYDKHYQSEMCQRENEAVKTIFEKYGVENKKTLDVGCGTGFALDICPIRKYKGIDISSEMIERAKAKYPSNSFIASDIQSARLGLEMFDCALSLFSIPYIGEKAVDIIYSILKNNGICICVYYNHPYRNRNSVYFGRKEYFEKNVQPSVKSVIDAFRRRFETLEEHDLTKDCTYSVSVFKKTG